MTQDTTARPRRSRVPSLLVELWQLLAAHRPAVRPERVFDRLRALVVGQLCTLLRHTVTQALLALGLVDADPGAFYRLFGRGRLDYETLTRCFLRQTLAQIPAERPLRGGGGRGADPAQQPAHAGDGLAALSAHALLCQAGSHRAQCFVHLAALLPRWQGYSRALPLRLDPAFPPKAVPGAAPSRSEAQAGQAQLAWLRARTRRGRAAAAAAAGAGRCPLRHRGRLAAAARAHGAAGAHGLQPRPLRPAPAGRAPEPPLRGAGAHARTPGWGCASGWQFATVRGARARRAAALPGGGALRAPGRGGPAALPAGGQRQPPGRRALPPPPRGRLLPGQRRPGRGTAVGAAPARRGAAGLGLAALGGGGRAPRDEERLRRGPGAVLEPPPPCAPSSCRPGPTPSASWPGYRAWGYDRHPRLRPLRRGGTAPRAGAWPPSGAATSRPSPVRRPPPPARCPARHLGRNRSLAAPPRRPSSPRPRRLSAPP